MEFIRALMYFLYDSESPAIARVFIYSCMALSLNGIFFNYFPRLNAFLLWFVFGNILNSVYSTKTAGESLCLQLLFFNIFFSGQKEIKNESLRDLDKAFHNVGVLAILIQICIVYFMSGLAKVMDKDWLSGKAIVYASHLESYSVPALYNIHPNFFWKFLNYFVMAYQLLFPILIWSKKTKNWFLLLGIIQHLYIAFIMGLPSFGFIMIISYSIFYLPEMRKSQKSL